MCPQLPILHLMGGRTLTARDLLVAFALASGLLISLPAAAAGPTPEQTIAAIEAKKEAAEAWIDQRADDYFGYLATNPTPPAAAAERDRALAEIAAKAAEADVDISGKMEQHPNNQDVQEVGQDAIANVYGTADSESTAISQAYNAYIGGSSTTTTSTTLPPSTTTTTQPPPTTTTTSITPTSTSSTTTTIAADVSTTTVVGAGSGAGSQSPATSTSEPTQGSSKADDEDPGPAAIAGAGPKRPGLIAAPNLNPDPRIAAGGIASANPVDIRPVLDMLRLRLPSVLSEPLVDLLVVLSAIAAAFMSGIGAVGWPTAILICGFLGVQLVEALRRKLAQERPTSS